MKRPTPAQALEAAKLFLLGVALLLFLAVMAMSSVAEAQTKAEIEGLIREAAQAQGIEPELALAIAEVESGLNPKAVGGLGELGVFQLRPEFHNVKPGCTRHNIEVAVSYLAYVKEIAEPKYGEAWFIAYNLGPHYSKPIRYPTLFPYYLKVIAAKERRMLAAN